MDKGLKEKIISVIEENATNLANGNLGENFIRLNPQIFEKVGFQAFSFAPLKVTLESPYIKSKHKTTDFDGRDVDGLVICYEDGEHSFDVAKFNKEKNQWVLTDEMIKAGITTEILPAISGIQTVSKPAPVKESIEVKQPEEIPEDKEATIEIIPKEQPKQEDKAPSLLVQHRSNKKEMALEFLSVDENIRKIATGQFPQGCELHNFKIDFLHYEGHPLKMDDTRLEIEGCTVATLISRMNCWVLSDGVLGLKLSPEQLPVINGQPTITAQQYQYMQAYVQPQFEKSKAPDKAVSPFVMSRYYNIPESVMHILSQMDKHPTETEIQDYCKINGDNKSLQSQYIPVSFSDLIVCTFGENITRIPELEVDTKSEQKKFVATSINDNPNTNINLTDNEIEDR